MMNIYKFSLALMGCATFAFSLCSDSALASGKWTGTQKKGPSTKPQVLGNKIRSQPTENKIQVDFDQNYNPTWDKLSVGNFFSLLQNETHPDPQFVIDWCNALVNLFKDENCQKDITPISISRTITLLGQKAKADKRVKSVLNDYFKEKPELMEFWVGHAIDCLNSTYSEEQFDQQALANILYGHAQLGLKPEDDFLKAWKEAALARLKSKDPKEQFNQQELANIFYGHAQLGLKPEDDFLKAWKEAALARLKSKDPKEQFNEQDLANIFYGHAQLGLKPEGDFLKAWKEAPLARLKSKDPKEQFDQKALHSIYLTIKRFSLEKEFEHELKHFSPMKEQQKKKSPKGSDFQKNVSQSLSSFLGIEVKNEVWVDSIASCVDMYVPSIGLIIEADGPSHFFLDTREYKPKNRIKDEILKNDKQFKGVIRVPYFEWDNKTPEAQKEFLQKKVGPFLQTTKTETPAEITVKEEEKKPILSQSKLNPDSKEFVPARVELVPVRVVKKLNTQAPAFVPPHLRSPSHDEEDTLVGNKWRLHS